MKLKYYFVLLVFFYVSCNENTSIIPPKIRVNNDSVMKISTINSVSYIVDATSDEEMKMISVHTYPDIFKKDTVMMPMYHHFLDKITVAIDKKTQDSFLGQTIRIDFTVKDNFNSTTVSRQLLVVNDYQKLVVDSAVLSYSKDSAFFYSFANHMALTYNQISDINFDIAFIFQQNYTFSLCSPNAYFVAQMLYDFSLTYNQNNKYNTLIARINCTEEQINSGFVYDLLFLPEYIGHSQYLGIGATNLNSNTFLAFITKNNKKGIIIVKNVDFSTKKIFFKYYIQL